MPYLVVLYDINMNYICIAILFAALAGCNHKLPTTSFSPDNNISNVAIVHETDSLFDKLVKVRRDLHAHPELAGNEQRTRKVLTDYLSGLGFRVETNMYGYGVVAILQGSSKGKNIAWRADMDALPTELTETVDFKSGIKGVAHGCGHDVHMAIALGIAEVLAKNRSRLHGTVSILFQPEEETFIGAKKMLDNGVFKSKIPAEIYGLHVTALPVGDILVKPGEIFAYQRRLRIVLKNSISTAELNILSGKIASALVRTREGATPWQLGQITDPQLGIASAASSFESYRFIDGKFSIRMEKAEYLLEADLYETDKEELGAIISRVKQIINSSGYSKEFVAASYIQENPTVVNDTALTATAMKTLNSIYGTGTVSKAFGQVPYFNDDFAYYQNVTRGVYFLLGGSNKIGAIAMNHAPDFAVDEECIRIGVSRFASLLMSRLQ